MDRTSNEIEYTSGIRLIRTSRDGGRPSEEVASLEAGNVEVPRTVQLQRGKQRLRL